MKKVKDTTDSKVAELKEEMRTAKRLNYVPDSNVTDAENCAFAMVLDKNWTPDHLNSKAEQTLSFLREFFFRGVGVLTNKDRDVFVEKLSTIISEPNRNKLWQCNHRRVLVTIDILTKRLYRFPTRSEIAKESFLSMLTVDKHLKAYYGSEEQVGKRNEYAVLRENVLATVYRHAQEGDMRAARCFLDATEGFTSSTSINNQNNFIQINGVVITQEQVRELPEEKALHLKQLLAAVVPTTPT